MSKLAPLLLTLAVATSAAASAQTSPPPGSFGVSVGAAPAGAGFGTGATLGASADVRLPRTPLALRGDVGFATWSRGGSSRLVSVTASAVLPLHRDGATSPYLVGGGGAYVGDRGQGLNPGLNVGAGLERQVGRVRAFGEARWHQFGTRGGGSRRMLPVVLGVRF